MSSPSSVGLDRGRCGPDPGERVSVEAERSNRGRGRCTVDPGAQWDKDERNRSGTRTLRLTSKVACGQVHRVWITRSSGSRSHLVTAAPGEAAPVTPHDRPFESLSGSKPSQGAPIHALKGARPGSSPARASPGDPASAHCPPRGSPHVSQRDTRDVDAGAEVGGRVKIRPRAAGGARPAGPSATPYPGAVSPIPTAGARSMVSASRP